jgi:predicted protein tyrosine phosphatase
VTTATSAKTVLATVIQEARCARRLRRLRGPVARPPLKLVHVVRRADRGVHGHLVVLGDQILI